MVSPIMMVSSVVQPISLRAARIMIGLGLPAENALAPVAFSRSEMYAPQPGRMGPIFEMRYYTLKGGTLPDTAKRWEGALPERIKLSPVVFAGGVEFGRANGFIHIWAYQDMNQRMQVRDEARKKGIWPPPGGGNLITQETKIVLPSAFSPLQ